MIFHIDGNSFYASCEQLFRPDLYHKPIAVLTNNDGIIIALNQKCKDLGYKRGDVYFKIRNRAVKDGVAVFSSNYALYADMSARLNTIYCRFAPEVEFYSIDESFLYFPDWNNTDYTELGHEIRNTVKREAGLPVSVGIAPNKTLAKLCNKLAKKYGGVCEWARLDQNKTLSEYPAGDIWGIGRAKTKFLARQGIINALQLKTYPLDKAKKTLTITGFNTVRELNGIMTIGKTPPSEHQSIIVSRSFSGPVFDREIVSGALAEYTQEAVKRLRADKLAARYITVYVMTNAFSAEEQYFNSATLELKPPSAFLPEILQAAQSLLNQIYRAGCKYRKTMIVLAGLEKTAHIQNDLFEDTAKREKQERLMKAFDKINQKWGRGTIRQGTAAFAAPLDDAFAPWEMKREYLSPCYTTNLADIPAAY